MSDIPVCWRCGTSLEKLSLPFARLDECPSCEVQVHVCRMCRHFDEAVSRSCREDDAEEVREKERANYCDYFKPSPDAFNPAYSAADNTAAAQLEQLFGDARTDDTETDDGEPKDPGAQAADDLFK